MIHAFEMHRPDSIAAASGLLRELPNAALICGGTELLQVMKMGLARFDHLVDLKGVPELRGVERLDDGTLRIGAATTHREIEQSSAVAEAYPALGEMERHVANVRVRNMGTIGGNLCFAEPHSDPATFLLATEASLELATADERRELSVGEFVLDALTTAIEADEILVAVRIPAPTPGLRLGYRKLAFVERPAASVCCALTIEAGTVAQARVAVGSIGEVPALVSGAEEALVGADLDGLPHAAEVAAESVFSECDASDDVNGTAEYKRHLAGVLLRRVVRELAEEARNGR